MDLRWSNVTTMNPPPRLLNLPTELLSNIILYLDSPYTRYNTIRLTCQALKVITDSLPAFIAVTFKVKAIPRFWRVEFGIRDQGCKLIGQDWFVPVQGFKLDENLMKSKRRNDCHDKGLIRGRVGIRAAMEIHAGMLPLLVDKQSGMLDCSGFVPAYPSHLR